MKDLSGTLIDAPCLRTMGVRVTYIEAAIRRVHLVSSHLDAFLREYTGAQLSQTVEMVTLSAIVGNVFRAEIVRASSGRFIANRPHKYPDLLSQAFGCKHIEIKVSHGRNSPKAHSAQPGFFLYLRYTLASASAPADAPGKGACTTCRVWAVKAGYLAPAHFDVYTYPARGQRTVTINGAGLQALEAVYVDPRHCPYAPTTRLHRKLADDIARSLWAPDERALLQGPSS